MAQAQRLNTPVSGKRFTGTLPYRKPTPNDHRSVALNGYVAACGLALPARITLAIAV
jgi:hypothetical protein